LGYLTCGQRKTKVASMQILRKKCRHLKQKISVVQVINDGTLYKKYRAERGNYVKM